MKPGEQAGSLLIEDTQEAVDVKDAVIDLSLSNLIFLKPTLELINVLESPAYPIEVNHEYAEFVLKALETTSVLPNNEIDTKTRVMNMLNGYYAALMSDD